jgi:hypothetical protein
MIMSDTASVMMQAASNRTTIFNHMDWSYLDAHRFIDRVLQFSA